MEPAEKPKPGRRTWDRREDRALRAMYPDFATKDIARILGRRIDAVYRRAWRLGLEKSDAYMASPAACLFRRENRPGIAFQFKKGHVPANKGLRRPGYSIGRGRMRETQFKKGQQPSNTLPVGTIKANADGYLRIKIADDKPGSGAGSQNWEFVHRRVWEAAHGPIPRGHRIWWKDGNHENCALENLELLSDKEHMARTTVHNLPPQLKKVIILKGAIKRRITLIEREKRNGGRKRQRQYAGGA